MAKPLPSDLTLPSPDKNPGHINFDLDEDGVKMLKGVKPGAIVRAVVIMKITDINMREPFEGSTEKVVGHLSGEIDTLKLRKDAKNVFAELADSDMSDE